MKKNTVLVFKENLCRSGQSSNDLTGTKIAEIEIALHMMGVRSGLWKQFWLGDTAKVHTAEGQYITGDASSAYTVGAADKRYNSTNGIWKEIKTRLSTDNIPRVVLSGTGASTTLVNSGALTDDAAS